MIGEAAIGALSAMGSEFLLRSSRVVFSDRVCPASLRICGGVIVDVAANDGDDSPAVVDVGSLVIFPGLIDPHVHFNDPGREEWEGFLSGTQAAAAGGITTVIDMPLNSSPVTTEPSAVVAKFKAAKGKLAIDVGMHGGLVPGNVSRIGELLGAGVFGIKAFLCHSGIDDFPAVGRRELAEAMPRLAQAGVPLLAHAEIAGQAPMMRDPRRYADYLASRPPSFERDAIGMLIDLCRQTGCRTHIVHLADAGSVAMLRDARADGLPITVEACPHYLTFAAEEIGDGQTQFKCAPPIRDRDNREGLWQALRDGVIDLIASDHSPCPPSMKAFSSGRFDDAWGGVSSVQLGLSAVWTEASGRGFDLRDVARWMSGMPGEVFGVAGGIAVGMPANLVVFDPEATFQVRAAELSHRHPVTPYESLELRGVVRATLLRGKIAKAGDGNVLFRKPGDRPS